MGKFFVLVAVILFSVIGVHRSAHAQVISTVPAPPEDFVPSNDKNDVSDFDPPEDSYYVRDMVKRALNRATSERFPSSQPSSKPPQEVKTGQYMAEDTNFVAYWVKTTAGQDCFVTVPRSKYLNRVQKEIDDKLRKTQESGRAKEIADQEKTRLLHEAFDNCMDRAERGTGHSSFGATTNLDVKQQCEISARSAAEAYANEKYQPAIESLGPPSPTDAALPEPKLLCKAVGSPYTPADASPSKNPVKPFDESEYYRNVKSQSTTTR